MFSELEFRLSNGQIQNFGQYSGKVLLIVNTATQCGLAPQFKGLENLHQKYQDQGLQVLGFPCNQFSNQEPVENLKMAQVCELNFGVTFPLTEKISVNGPDTHPVFAYLKAHSGWGIFGQKIKWNFTKFLVSRDTKKIKRFSPLTPPSLIEKHIQEYLKKSSI